MCILVVKPAGLLPPQREIIENCYMANPDGAGIAYAERGEVIINKGLWTLDRFICEVESIGRRPALIHCRVATQGSICRSNCHPFRLKNGGALAHNGVLQGLPTIGDMTDSEVFARLCIDKIDNRYLRSEEMQGMIEAAIGNSRIAIIYPTGEIQVFNSEYGETYQGIWYSNTSYQKMTTPQSYCNPMYYDDPFYSSDVIPKGYKFL